MEYVFYAALVALGYGAGRVHSWYRLRAKVQADAKAVVSEVKAVDAAVKADVSVVAADVKKL